MTLFYCKQNKSGNFSVFFVSVDFQNALWKLCVNKTKFFKAKPTN